MDSPLQAVPSVDEVALRIEVLELDGADGGKSQTA
jgi:hypothetical protein